MKASKPGRKSSSLKNGEHMKPVQVKNVKQIESIELTHSINLNIMNKMSLGTELVKEFKAFHSDYEPLPDPYETSRHLLEKEFYFMFKMK